MISTDIKTDVNREIKELAQYTHDVVSTSFVYTTSAMLYRRLINVETTSCVYWGVAVSYNVSQNLKHNIKQACISHLILIGIPSSLILSLKNRLGWVGGGWLDGGWV